MGYRKKRTTLLDHYSNRMSNHKQETHTTRQPHKWLFFVNPQKNAFCSPVFHRLTRWFFKKLAHRDMDDFVRSAAKSDACPAAG